MDIQNHLKSIFILLKNENKIIIPGNEISEVWDELVKEWVSDDSMTLFARKGGEIRGSEVIHLHKRKIITTDNTPAHWVFKNMVLDKLNHTTVSVNKLLTSNEFPISFIRKSSEHNTLIGKMVADKETRLGNLGWKLAHINRIALKRGKNISLEDYKNHHLKFLSLSNMYLIHKNFSGLAEIDMFNKIVLDSKNFN